MKKAFILICLMLFVVNAFAVSHVRFQNKPNGFERILEKIHNPKGPNEYIFKSDQAHFCEVTEKEFTLATINQAWICAKGWYWFMPEKPKVDHKKSN